MPSIPLGSVLYNHLHYLLYFKKSKSKWQNIKRCFWLKLQKCNLLDLWIENKTGTNKRTTFDLGKTIFKQYLLYNYSRAHPVFAFSLQSLNNVSPCGISGLSWLRRKLTTEKRVMRIITCASGSQGRKTSHVRAAPPLSKTAAAWPVISQIPLLEPETWADWLVIKRQGRSIIEMKHTWPLIAHSPGSTAPRWTQHCLPRHSHCGIEPPAA